MKKKVIAGIFVLLLMATIIGFSTVALAKPKSTWDTNPKHYEHGLAVDLGDGIDWYFSGPGTGVQDVPGHTWQQVGHDRVKGLHYNVGPMGIHHGGLPAKQMEFCCSLLMDELLLGLMRSPIKWPRRDLSTTMS